MAMLPASASRLIIIASLLLFGAFNANAATIYVDANIAGGSEDGTSWANAFVSLQDAIAAAGSGDDIWVAAGTYTPSAGGDRTSSFSLVNGVAIYGGFDGTEASLGQRDFVNNVTVLSGNIGAPGTPVDNSYHVVRASSGVNASAILDGFTITAGFANAALDPNRDGAGLYTSGAASPTLANIVFFQNNAIRDGGAVYSTGPSSFSNILFDDNSAGSNGGAVWDGGSATLTNVQFDGNDALVGGGLYAAGTTAVSNALFTDNGAIFGGGATLSGSATVTNATFVGNTAVNAGGGLQVGSSSSAVIVNTILWSNAAMTGPQVTTASATGPTISYCIIENSGGSGGGWDAGLGIDGGNNLENDPSFVNQTGGNLRLGPGSPAIDSGDNAAPNLAALDLDGNPRVFNGIVDRGPYETQGSTGCAPGSVLFVDASVVGGTGDGSSWANAYAELFDALATALPCFDVAEIWVAAGTYRPTSADGGSPGDLDATFQLRSGLAIYGGFAGDETVVDDRDIVANLTTLRGNLGMGRVRHVVTANNTDNTATLDGFTVTGGLATSTGGGGVYITNASPTFANLILSSNGAAGTSGGGMYIDGGSPTLSSVMFSLNTANQNGAGLCNDGGAPWLNDVTFLINLAGAAGGGMFTQDGNPTLVGVTFIGNNALTGAGLYNATGNPSLTNVVFTANTASTGGGFTNLGGTAILLNVSIGANTASGGSGGGVEHAGGNMVVTNSIIWGNTAASGAANFANNGGNPFFSYTIIEGSGGSGAGWDISLGSDGGNNLDDDPDFMDEQNGDLRLGVTSPAIDTGDNSVPTLPASDREGKTRIFGMAVDRGAYEFQPACPGGSIVYVDQTATGAATGTSWVDAIAELRDAVAFAQSCNNVTEIWVAAGTYKPAFGNNRTSSFVLQTGLSIYGGFNGTETLRNQRKMSLHVTTLSGDTGAPADPSDNSFHVVSGSGTDNTAILDGFFVSAGNADGGGFDNFGGGMINDGGSPTISNVIFLNNAAVDGAGIYNSAASPMLINVLVHNNDAVGFGGGIANVLGSTPDLIGVSVANNGTLAGGGGMFNDNSFPTLDNCIFWGNDGAGGNPDDISGNTGVISYSLIRGSGGSGGGWSGSGPDGGNNIDVDPEFDVGSYRLSNNSPAINAGDNVAASVTSIDLDGNIRVSALVVDIGAYEFQFATGIEDTPRALAASLNVYPNPFNPATTIRYTIARRGPVSMSVYDVAGRLVDRLVDEADVAPATYTVRYRPPAASGVYFLKLVAPGDVRTQKIILLK